MNIWFFSDPHLGHANIMKYCGRTCFMTKQDLIEYNRIKDLSREEQKKFKISKESLIKMDSLIINNFNKRVKPDDLVIFIGDFCFRYAPSESKSAPRKAFNHYRNQLNCKNWVWIGGNHDERNGVKTPIQSIVIKHGGKRIFITHNPKFAKEEFDFNFCGHNHNKYGQFNKLGKNSCIVDLSVEGWNYEPVTINEILGAHAKWIKSKKN